METYAPREVDMEAATARGIYQAWSFGPGLLDEEGQPKTRFLSDVKGANPRSAVGYYEPGHYCLVVVDGRGQGGSAGLNMQELSQLFASLGCRAAYNFDGGATAVMADAEGMISSSPRRRASAATSSMSSTIGAAVRTAARPATRVAMRRHKPPMARRLLGGRRGGRGLTGNGFPKLRQGRRLRRPFFVGWRGIRRIYWFWGSTFPRRGGCA